MRLVAVLVASLALVACNPGGGTGADQADAPGGGLFPSLTDAAYRAEGNIMRDGQQMPIVMIRSGNKMRMEIATPEGQSIIVSNGDTGESFVLTNAAGRTMAMRTSAATEQFSDPIQDWQGELATTATRTGNCSGAGQSGAEWARTEEGVPHAVCVTQDGIILSAREGDQTVWETTRVERAPQPAELFELPDGVQVIDLNNIPGMADALERARAAGQ
jgi:putative hemolysin